MYVSAFWPIIAGVVVVTWSLATSISSVASLKGDSDTAKERLHKLEAEMSTVRAENEVSKTERKETRDQVSKLQDQATVFKSGLDSEIATRGNAFVEVETQVDAAAQSINTQLSDIRRWNGGVSSALHDMGAKFADAPSGPWFFPNISNRHTQK